MKKFLIALLLLPLTAAAVDGSRDSNGSFTWGDGAGNVVSPNTLISPVWANQSFKDVKAMLSDSLSRSGMGGMLAPLKLVDTIVPATGLDLNWTGAPTTGIYHNSGTVGLQTVGADRQRWAAALTEITTPLTVSGTVTAASGNVLVSTGDVVVSAGGVNLSSATYQTITKTTGGDLYISHAVAGGNVIISTPVAGTNSLQVARLSVLGTNTISATIPLTMGNQLISNVLDPVSAQDVVTRGFLEVPAVHATATAWLPTTAYTADTLRSSVGNLYKATTSATSGSTPPSGTGTGFNDGGVLWDYVGVTAAAPTWVTLASANGDCTVSNSPAYTKIRGIVYMRGAMTSSSGGQCCTVNTLPPGFRPAVAKGFAGAMPLTLSNVGVWGCTSGGVGTTYFDSISFPAEQ